MCVCGRAVEETVYVFINLLPRVKREDPGASEQNTVKEVLGESEFQPGIILESKIVNLSSLHLGDFSLLNVSSLICCWHII